MLFGNRTTTRAIGNDAERRAEEFLKKQNIKILEKNFTLRSGEIDIIALDKQSLVFVEVRYRKNNLFGDPAETVNWKKQKKIINTANIYLQMKPDFSQYSCRFDVISIQGTKINWIQNAFDSST